MKFGVDLVSDSCYTQYMYIDMEKYGQYIDMGNILANQ